MKFIRFLALLLCAALLLPLVPVHAAQSGGSFYLTASTAGQTLIEPVAVPYTAGQTIRDALRGSGYAFGGIDTAFITDIEGVAGNFTVYYDGGAYSLDAIASPETVTAVVFSERERGFPVLLDAVTELGRFRERTDHVQNYPAAQQAYAAALSGLRTADEAGLTTLLAALRSAVAEYEAILNGTKYPVTFTDTAGTAAQLTLTDSYGNVTQAQGLRAEVVAGEYTFSLSDGGANRVDGTLTVAGAVEKQVTLPTGDWFGTIRLHNASGASAGAYPGTQDEKTHTAQFRVEDFRTLAYLYAERGVDAPCGRGALQLLHRPERQGLRRRQPALEPQELVELSDGARVAAHGRDDGLRGPARGPQRFRYGHAHPVLYAPPAPCADARVACRLWRRYAPAAGL